MVDEVVPPVPAEVVPPAPPVEPVKPVEPPAPPPPAEIKYELKLPDGSILDPAYVDSVVKYAKDKGLTNEKAQDILNQNNEFAAAYEKKQQTDYEARMNAWAEEVKADKEIGGADFEKNSELAKRVIEKFASDDLKSALDTSKLGNYPGLVRMMVKIGKAMGDDAFIVPGAAPAAKPTMAELLYGPKK